MLTTGIHDGVDSPEEYKLMGNYPNPFNNGTMINYRMPASSHVQLNIYSASGNKVKTLLNTTVPAGEHGEYWDGTNDSGVPVSSGIYFYRFSAGSYSAVKKLILLK
ncbi:FlgD immunoglobulin-like domain containing protein [candidate division KSB1 bacterium]